MPKDGQIESYLDSVSTECELIKIYFNKFINLSKLTTILLSMKSGNHCPTQKILNGCENNNDSHHCGYVPESSSKQLM